MRISDWSSDVCSSDLPIAAFVRRAHGEFIHAELAEHHRSDAPEIGRHGRFIRRFEAIENSESGLRMHIRRTDKKIGRWSCRERVCKYVKMSVVAVVLTKIDHQFQWTKSIITTL